MTDDSARTERRRRLLVATAIVAIVVLVGAIGTVSALIVQRLAGPAPVAAVRVVTPTSGPTVIEFPQDTPARTAGAEPCTVVRALSSFENAQMVGELAEAYNSQPRNVGGSCVVVSASKDKSGDAASSLAGGLSETPADQRATVWIPDAQTWISIARSRGAGAIVPARGLSVATSDIVLAMPQPLAEAIGWDTTPPTWSDVFAAASDADLWSDVGHPEWGAFKLGKTSPVVATSGAAAMFASYGTAAGGLDRLNAPDVADAAVTEEVRQHELSTSHYMATPEHFLWHARQAEQSGTAADFLSAVIVDEKSVWDYNRGITSRDGVTRVEDEPPREQLVPIYPADGFYTADNPAVVLTGDWVDDAEAAAAADFVRFTQTEQGQATVRGSGYRDLNGVLDEEVATVGRLEAAPEGGIPFPTSDVATAINAAFPEVRKRAHVLFLVDVSGSMDEKITASDTKLSAAKDAIALALDHFTTGDDVGLAAFAQAPGGAFVPGIVSPVADIGETRDQLLASLKSLTSMGDTPLYEAVDRFAKEQAATFDPTHINAIVLLSDGENDTNTPTTGEAAMLETLGGLHHSTPVLVFTLAYGKHADVETLQKISKATGAHYYDATDPTKVKSVLGDLVTSF